MIWKSKRSRRSVRKSVSDVKRRSARPQLLERRELMAADPIHVGVVYLETDYLESDNDVGSDSRGDRFLLSFTGGAADTELTELRILTDKDGDGMTIGDPIFDTQIGGRGKSGAHDFQIINIQTADGRAASATATVLDGGQELILNLQNFRAGDKLEFTLDVDEVLRNSVDLAVFNDRLDVITSGQEFQDSILEAVFNAPHYEQASADAIFLNDYGTPRTEYGLELPPDEGDGPDSRPNRSAAAVGSAVQQPKPISISGTVWLDNNLDSAQQTQEAGIAGVELALFQADSNGNYLDTGHRTLTDPNGRYEFPKSLGLMPAAYRVVEQQPEGLFSVAALPGSVNGIGSGNASDDNTLSSIMIPLGDSEATEYDFAEAQPASVAGHVYADDNHNGRRDPSESGIPGVTVRLVPIDTLTTQSTLTYVTAADGSYQFDQLSPGAYEIIEVDQPISYVDGADQAGTINGITVGLPINPGDSIVNVQLHGDDHGIEYNFGELAYGELSGSVFLVSPGEDCTGSHHAGSDQSLEDVLVELQSPDGQLVSSTYTSSNGHYRFAQVPPGNYRIVQYTPAGLLDGGAHVGQIDGITRGDSFEGLMIQQITMTPGGVGVQYDFCEIAPASLTGIVFHDRSDDGIRNSGEEGIAGVTITLHDQSGATVGSTETNSTGRYRFDGLEPGEYEIREQQPVGYLDGRDSLGSVNGVPAGTALNDRFTNISLPQGVDGIGYHFGELQSASLTGTVHVDLDGDCDFDPDETGLQGVTIRLLDAAGHTVATTSTNESGVYRFSQLRPGNYTVVQQQPDAYFDGGTMAGSHGGAASLNRVSNIALGSGSQATDYDFCEQPPASLSGSVYADVDGDCVHDAEELGIPSVLIELRDANGDRVATTHTDENGVYHFDNLRAGEYTVFEHQPAGYLQGGQQLGSAAGAILGVDLMSVSLEPGEAAVDYLFCEYQPGSISGSVWEDIDVNQTRDAGEEPISEVTVKLLDESGNIIRTTKTDVDGNYRFENLPRGVYSVSEEQPDDFFHGGQVPGNRGGIIQSDDLIVGIRIGSSDLATGYDFPEITPAMLSGYVFIDGDTIQSRNTLTAEAIRMIRDGVRTTDDTPIQNVQISIRDAQGLPLTDADFLSGDATSDSVAITDAGGHYVFQGLRPGIYTVHQSQPDTLIDAIDTPGTSGGIAVNEGDLYTSEEVSLIATVAGVASHDVILQIQIDAGMSSEENNFSEVELLLIIDPIPDPKDPDPQLPNLESPERLPDDPIINAPDDFAPQDPLYSQDIDSERRLPRIYGDLDMMTWHLSVINGGYPRGAVGTGNLFREAAKLKMRENWSRGEQTEGTWKLLTIEGEVIKESEAMTLGAEDAIALVGDFNGDGEDETAIYLAGQWYIDLNGNGVWDSGDLWIMLGTELDFPVVGDWDGDGKDDIGIYGRRWEKDLTRIKSEGGLPDPSNQSRRVVEKRKTMGLVSARMRAGNQGRYLRLGSDGDLRADAVDHVFQFGEEADTPVTGDWNGDGIDQIGIFRGGIWVLDDEGDGRRKKTEAETEFGKPGDQPIVGDFDGDGIDEIGVIRGNTWIIDSDGDRKLTAADKRIQVDPQRSGSQPIAGDWDGDGKDEPGFYRDAG